MKFYSPSRGVMSLDEVFNDIKAYMESYAEDRYRLIIGTDSQVRHRTVFVTAVIIHRLGKGGRYFYVKRYERAMESMRQRIYYETSLSLDIASRLTAEMAHSDIGELQLEIHLDIGQKGKTRTLIKELVGMVIGSGYAARIKPDSFGAFNVADKHTKAHK